MNRSAQSPSYSWRRRTSCSSHPSQRRVQFSFAQEMQNGSVGRDRASICSSGRSSTRSPVEPVVVEAEAVDAVVPRELGLAVEHLGVAEVVEPKLRRELRLVVPLELGPRRYDVRPLREPLAPPEIVLGDRVELGQVEGDEPGA